MSRRSSSRVELKPNKQKKSQKSPKNPSKSKRSSQFNETHLSKFNIQNTRKLSNVRNQNNFI